MPIKTYFNWSTGKDASLALYYLLQNKDIEITKLLTSVNQHHNRVSMHGLRRELLEAQANAIGINLQTVELLEQPNMEDYNLLMKQAVIQLKNEGYTNCAFGDIFLEDLRYYRETQLTKHNINCFFPLWKKNTTRLIEEFIALGFKAIIIAINASALDKSFVGREINSQFIKDLPDTVDPCGENGEFHTFCYDGPIFKQPIPFNFGEKVFREYKQPKNTKNNAPCSNDNNKNMGFWFCDLILPSL